MIQLNQHSASSCPSAIHLFGQAKWEGKKKKKNQIPGCVAGEPENQTVELKPES